MLCGKIIYTDLRVYQIAEDLAVEIYDLIKRFPEDERLNLASQLRRAVCALPLNVAEGSGSISYRRYLVFLATAYASGIEVESSLRICERLGYFPSNEHQGFMRKLERCLKMLYRYMEYIENKTTDRQRRRANLQRHLHGVTEFRKPKKEDIVLDGDNL